MACFISMFISPDTLKTLGSAPALVDSHFYFQQCKGRSPGGICLQDIYFLTGDLKPQHSLYLRDKAEQLRQLILLRSYAWVNGRNGCPNF